MKKLGVLIVLCLLTEILAEETRVELLQILFRHGARTPVVTYPNDKYQESYWKNYGGFGQLTPTGMQQHYEFGQFMRQRYSDFLNESYNRERVFAISTDFDRTLMSAYSFLASLYKPEGEQIWNKNVSWQPIPVHIGDSKVFLVQENCPRYQELTSEVVKTPEFVELNNKYKPVLDIANKESGFTDLDLLKLWKVADAVTIEKMFNLSLPDWVNKYYNEIKKSQDLGFNFDYFYTEMAKLAAGGIVNEIRKNIEKKIQTNSAQQFFLFSSHDTYVASLTKLLNLTSHLKQPPFASSVILELRKSKTSAQYYVQVYLKNNTLDEMIDFKEVNIYGCEKLCPLEDFMRITDSMAITNYAKECVKKNTKINLYNLTFISAVVFALVISLVVSVFSIISCRYSLKRFQYRQGDL